eukprot:scpid103993/ scgid26952/ 
MKRTGNIRICGEYKCTVNQSAKVNQYPLPNTNQYPLPNIEDLYQKLSNGKFFSKLDLQDAYQQLLLDDESKLLTTINTSKGLHVYNTLPFGVYLPHQQYFSAPWNRYQLVYRSWWCTLMTSWSQVVLKKSMTRTCV